MAYTFLNPAKGNLPIMSNALSPVIRFDEVTKIYNLQKQHTFKEFLPALIGGQSTTAQLCALNKISFALDKGKSLAIMGRNGSGKSTILKLVAGVTQQNEGTIEVRGRVAPLIELGAGFHPELTGRENVYLNGSILGIKRARMNKLYAEIVAFAELEQFMDQPVKHYSSGMYMRLAFAVAVAEIPDILLVDEILAVGDIKFQKKCLRRIEEFQKAGSTMIMVSHNVTQMREHCELGLVIEKSNKDFFGPIGEAIARYEKIMV